MRVRSFEVGSLFVVILEPVCSQPLLLCSISVSLKDPAIIAEFFSWFTVNLR